MDCWFSFPQGEVTKLKGYAGVLVFFSLMIILVQPVIAYEPPQTVMLLGAYGKGVGSYCGYPYSVCYATNDTFYISVILAQFFFEGPYGSYSGFRTEIDLGGLNYTGKNDLCSDEVTWPEEAGGGASCQKTISSSGQIRHTPITAGPASTFTGPIVRLKVKCGAPGQRNVTL